MCMLLHKTGVRFYRVLLFAVFPPFQKIPSNEIAEFFIYLKTGIRLPALGLKM